MWTWALTAYLITLTSVATSAGYVALFAPDPHRAYRAYRIFKIAITATLGSSGLLAILLHLYELGFLN